MAEKTQSPPKPSIKKKLTADEVFYLMKKGQLNQQIPPLPPGYPDPNKPPAKKKLTKDELFSLLKNAQLNQNVPTPPPGYKFPTDNKDKDKK